MSKQRFQRKKCVPFPDSELGLLNEASRIAALWGTSVAFVLRYLSKRGLDTLTEKEKVTPLLTDEPRKSEKRSEVHSYF